MSVKRFLATFFRGWRLYIPVLLFLLVATVLGTYYLARSQYQATARIWVDNPALDNVLDPNSQAAALVSPAQQQADKMNQLLQTDSFIVSILKSTDAATRLTNDSDRDQSLIKDTRGKILVAPLGANTIKITYSGSNPILCQEVVQSTIDQYRGRDLTGRVEQSAIESQFYQKQLQIYQDQVDAATKRVDDFQHQYPSPDPSSPQYLELQSLQRELESARALLSTTQTKIAQANAADTLSDTSSQNEFQVLDAPTVPNQPAATLTHLVEYLALGLAASLGLVILAVAFATWQDTTIRNSDDLARLTGVPVLDVIPHLQSSAVADGGSTQPKRVRRSPQKAPGQFDEPAAAYQSRVVE